MLKLEPITGKNIWQIVSLSVREDQKNYVAENTESILEAYVALTRNGAAFPFGLYDGELPVGFLMVGYGVDDDWGDAPAVARNSYNLWRLMIDRRYQGRGYGREAVRLALDFIRTKPCGAADLCWLSYEPGNETAKNLYHSFGFRETGDMDDGECIAVLPL